VARAVLVLHLRPVDESGMILDWKGELTSPQQEGVVCLDGNRIVGSMDWESVGEDTVSVENIWVDADRRSDPRVLLVLVRHFEERCPHEAVIVGEYINPKVVQLISALNRRRGRTNPRHATP
jgi:hypothetical protein